MAVDTVADALASPLRRQRTTIAPDGSLTREEEYRSVAELTAQDEIATAASTPGRQYVKLGTAKGQL